MQVFFSDADYPTLRAQLLAWASGYPCMAVLDSCGQPDDQGRWQLLVAVGSEVLQQPADTLPAGHWYFGGIGYEWKDALEPVVSPHPPYIPFPDGVFFHAETVLGIARDSNRLEVLLGTWPMLPAAWQPQPLPVLELHSATDYEAYKRAFAEVQTLLHTGEVYEMNLCRELRAHVAALDGLGLWQAMVQASPVPMAAYLRLGRWEALCASPERYLRHSHGLLCSQPIKGTVRRQPDPAEDAAILATMPHDPKLRAENVMIADLVRNDLSRLCVEGSVQALLCQTLSLSTLHHLMSTVWGLLRPGAQPLQALAAAFPPGSMTGAPKVAAMQAIAALEAAGRGLYSGSIGYMDPQQGYDFNVVIRSFVYDRVTGHLSAHIGGAITVDSQAETEWEETETKALALRHLHTKLP